MTDDDQATQRRELAEAARRELADQEAQRRELGSGPVIVGRTTLHRYAWFVR